MHLHNPATNPYVKVFSHDANWLVSEPWRDLVVNETTPSWLELSNDARAELVKEGDSRQVWRVTVGQETIYAKIYFAQNLIDHMASLIGCSRAKREWHTLTQASRLHLSVPEPIALGLQRSNRHACVLLTRAIHDAESLSKSWQHIHDDEQNATKRAHERAMIRATAMLFAHAHEAGFIHADPHPGNILVSAQACDVYQAWYVDVLGSKMKTGKLTIAQVAQSLAQLDQYFHRVASRTDRLRFLIHYLKERNVRTSADDFDTRDSADDSDGPIRDYVRAVLSARSGHAYRLAKQWDRRLSRDGKYFGLVCCQGGWRGRVVKQLSRRHVFPERDIPDRSTSQWRAIIEKLTKRVRIMESKDTPPTLESPHDSLLFEWHRPTGIIERWRWTLFGSPCRDAFITSHRHRHRDIECPLILGYVEHRHAGFIDEATIIRPAGKTNT